MKLTSFKFASKDGKSFIIGYFASDDAKTTAQGIICNTGDMPFEMLLRAKSMEIPFILTKIGTWTDKDGKAHDKFTVAIGTM